MTVAVAAKRIGISVSKVYQLVAAGRISYYRVGKKILFQDEDVAAFLSSCRVAASPAETISHAPRFKLKHIQLSGE
jgi:excisionase family DNA binding protein